MSENAKRILMVCPDLGWGGVALNTLSLAREFRRRGMSVLVVALDDGARHGLFDRHEVETIVHPSPFSLLRGRAVGRRIREFRPEIVHAMALTVTDRALTCSQRCRVPMTVTINRFLNAEYDVHLLPPNIPCIAVSAALQTHLINGFKVARSRVHIIANGIDPRDFPLPQTIHPRAGRFAPVIATQGHIAREKGQRDFLTAAAKILTQVPEAEFLVIGEGPDLSALRAQAVRLGIVHRVTFSGQDRMSELALRDIDVFVEPSCNEGFGLAVLQAMAWARPVVASGVGGLYALIKDGETGILVPKEQPDSIAASVCELLTHPMRAIELGQRGREHVVRHFHISDIADAHIELYRNMLDARHAAF